jgi:hypothetical protein
LARFNWESARVTSTHAGYHGGAAEVPLKPDRIAASPKPSGVCHFLPRAGAVIWISDVLLRAGRQAHKIRSDDMGMVPHLAADHR